MRATAWHLIAWVFNQTHFLSYLFAHNCNTGTHTHTMTIRIHHQPYLSFSLPFSHTRAQSHRSMRKSLARIILHVLSGKPHQLSQQGTAQWNTSQAAMTSSLSHTHARTHTADVVTQRTTGSPTLWPHSCTCTPRRDVACCGRLLWGLKQGMPNGSLR